MPKKKKQKTTQKNRSAGKKKITVSLVIIVRNERPASEVLFPRLPLKAVDDVYVIDGNSTDGTPEFYKKKKIRVHAQTVKGLGGATFEARKQCRTDAMIFFHPDGNEDPADIVKVAKLLRAGDPFVIPSRMIKGAWNEEDAFVLRPRKWFNKALTFFVNVIWNRKNTFCSEIVQGFRGIHCDAFDQMQLTRNDCTIDFQMVIRALKLGIPITEFPTHEGERLFGETSFQSIDTGLKELNMLAEELFEESTYPSSLKS